MSTGQSKIFIISGPSGAGEDSVINGIRKKIKFNRIRTTITRKPRNIERQGKPYFFTTPKKFKVMIANHEFIEWAIVYGDYRGATKKEVNRVLKLKKPVIWKVDWQGVRAIKKALPETVAIFIKPSSYKVLEKRLFSRHLDTPQTIKSREQESKDWLKKNKMYDYVVINEDGKLTQTIKRVEMIIKKELQSRSK